MKRLLFLVVLVGYAVAVNAQSPNKLSSCYEPNIKKADEYYNKGDYRNAKACYEKALKCSEAVRYKNGKAARDGVAKCNQKLNAGAGKVTGGSNDVSTAPIENNTFTISTDGKGNKEININGVSFRMIYVEGGAFTMGCGDGEDCESDEFPAHSVTLSSYYIGETEVTQALWRAVMGKEPEYNGGWTSGYGKGDNYPAYYISYEDIKVFVAQLNRVTGLKFRMPTEAEWEFAARGGNKSFGYKYSGGDAPDKVACFEGGGGLQPVKKKRANELGIYDMSGNAYEWCADLYGEYDSSQQTNPQGPSSGKKRVLRGGDCISSYKDCRVANRSKNDSTNRGPSKGCRLAMD
ncbi:MAG: SUMF1/EgtB/PvdO family nonheme iron enzyme [Bacteroidales bacterium]|nr:SUMF1/EgtB/PvdO family nonheme iron enzyme [Bacteroidales bacterium]